LSWLDIHPYPRSSADTLALDVTAFAIFRQPIPCVDQRTTLTTPATDITVV
jgi:hypothetical protein